MFPDEQILMNILIYFPYNLRTVEQQSVMEMLVKDGNKVVLLTTLEKGYLHNYVAKFGVITESVDVKEGEGKIKFFRTNFLKLKSVIKKYNIDLVIAHQQIPALIAGVLAKIKNIKLIYIRHNSDEDYQNFPNKAKWLNKIVNRITPFKVAPSSIVKDFMVNREGVPQDRIFRVNYGYNFNQYEKANEEEVKKIKQKYKARLLILSIARLVPAKRHIEMFSVIRKLIQEGVDCKFICLGGGSLEMDLRTTIENMSSQEHIFLLGRRDNIFDYIQASDVFLHLSSTEASNSAVKEVGLCKKTVIVCRGVGDFDDYILNGKNGFLVDKDHPAEPSYKILKSICNNEIDTTEIGQQLFNTVTSTFNIENIAVTYRDLISKIVKAKKI